MAETQTPGMIRPGGRTARVRRSVMEAAEDALVEGGFGALDLGSIARRAGVGRATVYRRWGTVIDLVVDLLADMAQLSMPRARSGSLREDLRANARLVGRTLVDRRQGAVFRAMIAAATAEPRAAEALQGFYRIRLHEWAPVVEEAIDRGEVPAGTDAREVVAAASAPLYYRLLLSGGVIDRSAADRAADAAYAAAVSGVFVVG